MSGRRRVIPLDEVAARRPWVLRVDPSQVTSEQVEVQAPCGPHEDLRAKTFAFSFVRQSLPVLEVLRGPEGLEAGARVPFVTFGGMGPDLDAPPCQWCAVARAPNCPHGPEPAAADPP